jgi:hypothetical protein
MAAPGWMRSTLTTIAQSMVAKQFRDLAAIEHVPPIKLRAHINGYTMDKIVFKSARKAQFIILRTTE